MENIKVVVIGDGAVGKSCLLIAYTTNSFPDDYVPTVFDNYSASSFVNGKAVNLGLWDTAGQEDYDRLRPLSYPETNCFLICFSVVDRTSFENISTKWVPEIEEYASGVPMILVGTKCDLRHNQQTLTELQNRGETQVTEKEAKKLADTLGFHCYVETSAKTQRGLREVFENVVDTVLFPKSNSGKGLFSFFGGGKKNKSKKSIRPPTPPIMPAAGKAPSIDILDSTFGKDFNSLLKKEIYPDVTLVLKNKEIEAHKVILSIASDFFDTLFMEDEDENENEKENEDEEIDIIESSKENNDDEKIKNLKALNLAIIKKYDKEENKVYLHDFVDPDIFQFILSYAYVGHIDEEVKDLNLKKIGEIEKLGILMGIDDIKTFCDNLKAMKNQYDKDLYKGFNLSLQSYILDQRSEKLRKLFRNGCDKKSKFSDISFLVDIKKLALHKAILVSRCKYFETMLDSSFIEGQSDIVTIEEDPRNLEEFISFIQFLYTGHTYDSFKPDNVLKILMIANKLGNKRLISFCELFVSKVVEKECAQSIENADIDVIGILMFALCHNAKQLGKFCKHFIASNFEIFKKREEWKTLTKDKTVFKEIKEAKWPPDSYLKAVEQYQKDLEKYNKKIGKKSKSFNFLSFGATKKEEKKQKKKNKINLDMQIHKDLEDEDDIDIENNSNDEEDNSKQSTTDTNKQKEKKKFKLFIPNFKNLLSFSRSKKKDVEDDLVTFTNSN